MDKPKPFDIDNAEKSQPLYVSIYVKIYNMIKDGTYKSGDPLPGENSLSKDLKVSRSTLRQALLILQEDGIVYNVKGKGNFVANSSLARSTGFEKLVNPVYQCGNFECDDIELDVVYEKPNEALHSILQLNKSSIIVVARMIYKSSGESVCFGVACIPYEQIALHSVKLDSSDEISHFVNEKIYDFASNSHTTVKITVAGESIAAKLEVEQESALMHIEEILLSTTGDPIAFMKYYFKPHECDVFVNRRNLKK